MSSALVFLLVLACLILGCSTSPSADLPDGYSPPRRGLVAIPREHADASGNETIADAGALDTVGQKAPDVGVDTTSDLGLDLTKVDVLTNTPPDLKDDLFVVDLRPTLTLGIKCSVSSDCTSGFCTDGVCCQVEKCVNTCVPGISACAPYNGFTCAPLGTCRGF